MAGDQAWTLLEKARAGDADAFEALLRPMIGTAHRYASALLPGSGLAEDAVQEAAVRAWRKLGNVRTGMAFQPWFLGIVARQCKEQVRNRWWRVIRTAAPPAAGGEPPEDAVIRRATLRDALAKLGHGERQVVILRLHLELPWAEVAAAAGLSEAGARTRYYRALERLRPKAASKEVLT